MNLRAQLATCNSNLACSLCSQYIQARSLFWRVETAAGRQTIVICTDHIPLNTVELELDQDTDNCCSSLTPRGLDIRNQLIPRIQKDWELIYSLSPDEFEQLVQDRLLYSGMQAFRTGRTNRKDGGVDIVFWIAGALPILGVVQVKHHCSPAVKTGADAVRDLAGVMLAHRFNVAFLVTNTEFTADAKAFAHENPTRIQLRDGRDVKQWIDGVFALETWQSETIKLKLCPGTTFDIPSFL